MHLRTFILIVHQPSGNPEVFCIYFFDRARTILPVKTKHGPKYIMQSYGCRPTQQADSSDWCTVMYTSSNGAADREAAKQRNKVQSAILHLICPGPVEQ